MTGRVLRTYPSLTPIKEGCPSPSKPIVFENKIYKMVSVVLLKTNGNLWKILVKVGKTRV